MNVVLFDIDGTLLVTNRAGSSAMHAALREEFGIDEPATVEFAGCTDRGIITEFFEHHEVEPLEENVARFVASYLRHLPISLTRLHGTVLPGVVDLLMLLRDRAEVAVGLLTGNLEQGARLKLAHFELNDHFSFGGFGDRQRLRNEVAREALQAAIVHVGEHVDPSQVIVIGDTAKDIACAHSIGARAVAVATGSHSRKLLAEQNPDLLIDDLADPTCLLNMLTA